MESVVRQYEADADALEKVRALYQANGFVLVRNAIDTRPLNALVASTTRLMAARLRASGQEPATMELDALLEQLARLGEDKVNALLRAAREALEFHRLVLAEDLLQLVSVVSHLEQPQVISETCMLRIDRNLPSSRDFDWHYDAAYTAQPAQALTCWVPLVPIDANMGPLRVIPGSHREPHCVRFIKEAADKKLAGPKRIELADRDLTALEARAVDVWPMQPGDIILLHGWTLHRSGVNQSTKARWVFNPRYSDLLDSAIVTNDWRVSRAGDPWVFSEYHPELVAE